MQNQNFQPNYKQGVNSGYVHSPRKLFRSRNDRIIAGVCGGLGTYLDLDTNLVRVLFVIFSIFYGGGIIIYIIMIMLIPESPYDPWLEPNTSKAY
ncbi:MAG: PspC domain-containing protein [Candidatus Heimdallarchaeota archaeon]|nr:PspC domain-containing protein [Candidatus Heimdallarchaeota archaeon]MDH5644913.1 PspC domain-containing protein [Candidatus Heimdallarchaeota archaeon]